MLVMLSSVTTPCPEEIKDYQNPPKMYVEAVCGRIVTETLSKGSFTLRESGD